MVCFNKDYHLFGSYFFSIIYIVLEVRNEILQFFRFYYHCNYSALDDYEANAYSCK